LGANLKQQEKKVLLKRFDNNSNRERENAILLKKMKERLFCFASFYHHLLYFRNCFLLFAFVWRQKKSKFFCNKKVSDSLFVPFPMEYPSLDVVVLPSGPK
jgi:hypothetical protein